MTPEDSYQFADWHLLVGQTNQTPKLWSRWVGPESWNTERMCDLTSTTRGENKRKKIPRQWKDDVFCFFYLILLMMSQRRSVRSCWVCFICWTEASCWSSFLLQRPLQHKYYWLSASSKTYHSTQFGVMSDLSIVGLIVTGVLKLTTNIEKY